MYHSERVQCFAECCAGDQNSARGAVSCDSSQMEAATVCEIEFLTETTPSSSKPSSKSSSGTLAPWLLKQRQRGKNELSEFWRNKDASLHQVMLEEKRWLYICTSWRILACTAVNWFYLLERDLLAYNNWHTTILKSYWDIAIFISFIKAVVISKNQATYRCCFVVAVYYVLYYLYCGAQRSEIYLKIVYLQLRLQLFIIIKKENLAMTMLLQTKMAIQHW